MDISKFGKGAVKDSPDARDFRITPEMLGSANIDWTLPFLLPEPPDENQGISDACVAYAWSYYHWQLKLKDFSRRDLFARIALTYGAEIREGGKAITGLGQATRDEVPDPNIPTPTNMRDKTGVTPDAEASDKELYYFVLPQQNITGVAWGVQAYKGVVFGVIGSDEGWKDRIDPRPPKLGEVQWGHALYALGSHIHDDGQKCIIAKSSMGNVNGTLDGGHHHIKENYFLSGDTFNAWTLIPKGAIMSNAVFVHKVGTPEYGFYLPALSEQAIADKALNVGANILKADGSIDYSQAKEVSGL